MNNTVEKKKGGRILDVIETVGKKTGGNPGQNVVAESVQCAAWQEFR